MVRATAVLNPLQDAINVFQPIFRSFFCRTFLIFLFLFLLSEFATHIRLLQGPCPVIHLSILPGLGTSTLGLPFAPRHHSFCAQTIGPLPVHHRSLLKILNVNQLESVVNSDSFLPWAPGAPATWPPLWSFFFRIIVITEAKLEGAGSEGLLSALFPPQPPEGPA